ncbi:hypothetical protein [Haloplanus sp. C73]|uniref:hypothetical protein n=1 Tax=Haloplanus sp. C73 TaxID=3421641 RepID=UPI003EB7DDB1
MAKDPDPDTSLTTDEVRVGKTFEAERFPVPAIAFDIESVADEPVRIRLVDDIPESFEMEGVGFHPDYEGDNWTAYRDNRVAYERTLEPGEEVLTVYGIRLDEGETADDFLGEPTVELIEHGDAAATGDVLGRETTQVVRDALSGEEPDGDSALAPGSLLGDSAPDPRERVGDPVSVLGPRDEDVTSIDVDEAGEEGEADEAEDETDDDDETSEETENVPSGEVAEALDPRDREAMASQSPTPSATPGSVAAALAAEIRAGEVDDDDLAVIDEALASEVPTSVDVRVSRLQSQTEDLLAYRDALADFLDENGTASELLGDVSEQVTDLSNRVDGLESSLAAADADRDAIEAEMASVQEQVTDVSDTVDDVAERVDSLETDFEDVESTVETLDDRLDAVADLEDEIEAIHDELSELQEFRDRLSSAFGTEE